MTGSNDRVPHIVVMAGEASGDAHAACLVAALRKEHPDWHFSGIGGAKMQQAGVELVQNLDDLNIMGFVEVLRHLRTIRKTFKNIQQHLLAVKPDLLILVDYPGFNLRLAKWSKLHRIRVLYYISPQLWAWKPNRIKIIQRYVDKMAVIFPFEKKLYEEANVPVAFVGHPLVEQVKTTLSQEAVREKWGIECNRRLIGLLPGSRINEVKRVFPAMLEAAKLLCQKHPDLEFVLPVAATLSQSLFESYAKDDAVKIHYIRHDAYHAMQICHSLMVTSGTATLEAAMLAKPMVIVYKAALLTYAAAVKILRVKYIGLCNLLADKMLVPEIVQQDLTPEHLFEAVNRFLMDAGYYQSIEQQLITIRRKLSSESVDTPLTEVVNALVRC